MDEQPYFVFQAKHQEADVPLEHVYDTINEDSLVCKNLNKVFDNINIGCIIQC